MITNLRMQEKLSKRECLDVRVIGQEISPGRYLLHDFIDDVDYADAQKEAYIWSIGVNLETGEIHASTSGEFYQNPDYRCIWLR